MLAEKNLTGKFKFQSSEAVKEFSKWLVSIGQDFSYKEKDYMVTVKFDFDEDYNAAEAKDYELEKEADPQMSLELEEVEDGATSLSD